MSFTWPIGKRMALSLSFDDARPSTVDNGIPLLDRHGVKATFYVVPGAQMDSRLEQWRMAAAAGHEMGNHTVKHPCSCQHEFIRKWGSAMEDYDLAQMEAEIKQADAAIQEKLGVTPRTFAYPCGETWVGRGERAQSYVPFVARHFLAARAGSASGPVYVPTCDLAHLRAHSMDGASFATIKPILEKAAQSNGWVILLGHDVGLDSGQSVKTDMLEELCAYANDPANGVWIDTFANVAEYVKRRI